MTPPKGLSQMKRIGIVGGIGWPSTTECLACPELPLAFARMKQLPTFEYDGILFINTTAVHIDPAFRFEVDV